MSRLMKTAVAAVAALVAVQTASAAIITQPTGLAVGAQYRLVFVTSTTTTATDTTAAYYNNFVSTLANSVPALAALGTTWSVLGNLNGADPQVNTGTTPPGAIATYRLDGTAFATSYDDLWDAPAVPVLYNEKGEAMNAGGVGAGRVWTGMGEAMSVPNWNAGSYIGNGGAGGSTGAGSTDSAWYTYGFHGMANTTENHLYAMSGVITVIPEPATFGMIGAAGIAMLLRRRFAK
jgi:hypothetical protein